MRLFIAVNFNDATRAKLIALRDELKHNAVEGRFSAPENLHLTLVFLGECDAAQAARAGAAMDVINLSPITVTIDRVGRFKRHGGDVWWAGVRENKSLLNLYNELTDKLASYGFELENRKYSPHVTLGREIVTNGQPREIEPFSEIVSAFELMKSERLNGKLAYTAIHGKAQVN